MTKRRLLRWSLVLVILAAFAAWLEPTRVVRGWPRGEAFYHGRPTSYWEGTLANWDVLLLETGKKAGLPIHAEGSQNSMRLRGSLVIDSQKDDWFARMRRWFTKGASTLEIVPDQ